jgi:ankyrin repeat protein
MSTKRKKNNAGAVPKRSLDELSASASIAIKNHDFEEIFHLLKLGIPADFETKHSETPLLAACSMGDSEVVSKLLRMGASINMEAKNGSFPLAEACKANHFKLVSLLIDGGVDINYSNRFGDTALIQMVNSAFEVNSNGAKDPGDTEAMAAYRERLRQVGELEEKSLSSTKCDMEESEVEEDEAESESESGNESSCAKNSSDFIGLVSDSKKMVKLLVSAGLDVNFETPMRVTAVTNAAFLGKRTLLEVFIREADADVNKETASGVTPLLQAAMVRNYYCLLFLFVFCSCNRRGGLTWWPC